MTAFVIVNPAAGHGRAGKLWPAIRDEMESAFPGLEMMESKARGHASQLARAALQAGYLNIIAVGGDGTINEAANGFFAQGMPVSPDAVLGFVAAGTRNNFARNFAVTPQTSVARLRKSHIRRVDIGRLTGLSQEGAPLIRHFINEASFGLTAHLARAANGARLTRLLGERAQAALALTGWRSPRLRLMADSGYDEIAGITLVAIANGRSLTSLDIAPSADPGDGKFDIVIAGGMPRRRLLPLLAAGRGLLSHANLRRVRAARFTAAPTLETEGPIEIETDGESAGLLPATFEILPSAINLRV